MKCIPLLSSSHAGGTGFKLAWLVQQIPAGSDQGFLLLDFIAPTELLYVQYLYSAVRLLPYLDCHVLWDKSPDHAYSALLHLYQMRVQLCIHHINN